MSRTTNRHTRATYLIVAVVMTLGLLLAPATVSAQSLDVEFSPEGTTTDPVRGELTVTVDYDGATDPATLDIIINTPTVYQGYPGVLGQDKGSPPDPVLQAALVAAADPTDHAGWDKELAKEIGFISANYDSTDREWTIKINTQKRVEVCDDMLIGLGWMPGQEVWFDGEYPCTFIILDESGNELVRTTPTIIFDNPVALHPDISYNAKGAQQKFWLNWIDRIWTEVQPTMWESVPVEEVCVADDGSVGGWVWAFDPGGVNLKTWGPVASAYDVRVTAGGRPYQDSGGAWHSAECVCPEGCFCVPDRFIEIQARATNLGDCEIEVHTCSFNASCSNGDCIPNDICAEVANAEKKFGELAFSKLDVHIEDAMPGDDWDGVKKAVEDDFGLGVGDDFAEWTDRDHEIEVDAGTSYYPVKEKIAEWVWADFLEVHKPQPAGGAVVHWWLAKDTAENQAWIQDLMDDMVTRAEDQGGRGHDLDAADSNDDWSATGAYDPLAYPVDTITDWIDPAGTANDKFATNTSLIGFEPPCDCDPYICKDPAPPHTGPIPYINSGGWYGRSLTMDYHPNEIPGVTIADLMNTGEEDVLIITFVEYQQDYNGENLVLIQIGKKHFTEVPVIPITEVKTAQLRWAGEKIVLEKDWSDMLPLNGNDGVHYMVQYNLEFGSDVGTLHPVGEHDFSTSEGQVIAFFDEDGISRCILESEAAGEADVDAALYRCETYGRGLGKVDCHLVGEIGFLVYFLEFEDVILAENLPQDPQIPGTDTVDITPFNLFQELAPEEENAEIAVQVRGFFPYQHSRLLATWRTVKELDINRDGYTDYYLPSGRYVLPDDWWLIVGAQEVDRRPNFDLMDQAHLDEITSDSELGPYDGVVGDDVQTTEPPGEAEAPTIGPFSTLQQWSKELMWVTEATVPADYKVAAPDTRPRDDDDVRNTVVPDGEIDYWDAPMPQALVIFDIIQSSEPTALLELDKGDLYGYGYTGDPKVYHSPYYEVEIPASPLIPPGYDWDSWGGWTATTSDDGPYEFWTDLGIKSTPDDPEPVEDNTQDLDIYSDNHGIAAIQIEALDSSGSVTVTATADFPYAPKRGKYGPRVSDAITAIWGPGDLDPHFTVDDVTPDVDQVVYFDPTETSGGQRNADYNYKIARWDWEGDGTWDATLLYGGADDPATPWDDGDPLALVSHAYPVEGLYLPCLQITDFSEPSLIRHECFGEDDELIVGNPIPCEPEPTIAEGFASIADELVIVYHYEGAGNWGIYWPKFDMDTIGTLEVNEVYHINVDDNCTLAYGSQTYELDGPDWNYEAWRGC